MSTKQPDTSRKQIKPSDAISWSLCKKRVWLDNSSEFSYVSGEDAFAQLIIERGVAHERDVLEHLDSVYEVQTASSPEDTIRMMAEKVPVIYQAQLVDKAEGIVGYPDFLILQASGSYQAADAKLAGSAQNKNIQIQMGVYRRLLKQGYNSDLPAIVFLGDGSQERVGQEADDQASNFLTDMRSILDSDSEPSVRYAHSRCSACPYHAHCTGQFESVEEISLLYGVDGRAVAHLEKHGIKTISQLANTDPESIPKIPYLKSIEAKRRAVQQAKSHLSGDVFQTSPLELPDGYWVHFDIEDNPLAKTMEKHVYLWGFLTPHTKDGSDDHTFDYVWTDNERDDYQGWIQFLAMVESYQQQHSDLILAHFSHHEASTIRNYATRYGMHDDKTVCYLLGENSPLFDLRKTVKDSLILPLSGYGLKDVCKHPDLVNFQWQDSDSGSQWSVVQFNRYLEENDQSAKESLKNDILSYNNDDVTATQKLEQWLRGNFGH